MASQRQYNFDFVLNAVMNGGFRGVFNEAQQKFVQLEQEIKNLQAIQRDISAYQKQTQAVQNTTQKLNNLKEQLAAIERQKGFLQNQIDSAEKEGRATDELNVKLAALDLKQAQLEGRIDTTSAALTRQTNQLEGTGKRLADAGLSTDNLAGKEEELQKRIEALREEQQKATEEMGNFQEEGTDSVTAVADALAASQIVEKLGAIKDAFLECVEVSKEFEKSMSAVEAIAGATDDEMDALTEQAKELGATTIYTAQQSAEAMEYMAMAGWDAEEMLAGMPAMTTLAAAAGEDLAQVSDIVTDNLTAFGLKASDTAHFADVLASAAANSNTNISIMGETFKSSAAVAGALGYSIEDVAVMTGLMANAGVKGSRAGTALRNIFNGLLEGATLTAESFGEVEYSVVNTDGTMKSLMETIDELRGYFDQMTEAEKVNNASNLAGMRGYNGLLAVLRASDEDFQSLYDSINNCSGAAEEMASIKLDNLAGDVTLLESATEALQNSIGEEFNPELRALTQLGTELVNTANETVQLNPALVKGVTAGGAAFLGLSSAVIAVNTAMKVFQALDIAAMFSGPAGIILAAGTAVATFAVGISSTIDEYYSLSEAAQEMQSNIESANETFEESVTTVQATADVAERYITRLEELEDAGLDTAESQKEYQNTLALLLQTVPELSDDISVTTDEYGRSTYALETNTDALRDNVDAMLQQAKAAAYQQQMQSIYAEYAELMLEQQENEIKLTDAIQRRDEASEKYTATQERINELTAKGANLTEEESAELAQAKIDLEYYANQTAKASGEVDQLNANLTKDSDAIAAADEAIAEAEQAYRVLTGAVEDYENGTGDAAAVTESAAEYMEHTMTAAQELATAYTETYDAALESFEGQFSLFDEAKASEEATLGAAQEALESQLAYWTEYQKNIETLKNISAEDLHLTQENYDLLMSKVQTGSQTAAGLAASMVEDWESNGGKLITEVGNTLGEISEKQETTAEDTAEWTTGLDEKMKELIENMSDDIEELDMSSDAALAAYSTIQSYLATFENMAPQAYSAALKVAKAARAGLNLDSYSNVYNSGVVAEQTTAAMSSVSYSKPSSLTIGGFASGTGEAPPGWAWVGEVGPELMRLHGGEQILPANISREAAQAYQDYKRYNAYNSYNSYNDYDSYQDYGEYSDSLSNRFQTASVPEGVAEVGSASVSMGGTTVEMHFHIEAGAEPETVDAWRDYASSGELREMILDVMESAQADARRRAMV